MGANLVFPTMLMVYLLRQNPSGFSCFGAQKFSIDVKDMPFNQSLQMTHIAFDTAKGVTSNLIVLSYKIGHMKIQWNTSFRVS